MMTACAQLHAFCRVKLEGGGCLHNATRAAHHLAQRHIAHARGVVDVLEGRLRDVRKQHQSRALADVRADQIRRRGVAVEVVRLVHHYHAVGDRGRRHQFDPIVPEHACARPLAKWLVKHVQLAQQPLALRRHHTLAQPARNKVAERWVARDEEHVRFRVWSLQLLQHLVHRDVRLTGSRWRPDVHARLALALGELRLLVGSQLLERQHARLVRLRKLRAVHLNGDETHRSARSPRLLLQRLAQLELEASLEDRIALLVQ